MGEQTSHSITVTRTTWIEERRTESFSSTYVPAKMEIGTAVDANGKYMEDVVVTKRVDDITFLAVYDGHGGKYCEEENKQNEEKKEYVRCVDFISQRLDSCLIPIFASELTEKDLRYKVWNAFRQVDKECGEQYCGINNGSTACVVTIKDNK